jgi:hypothetical protein
MTQKVVCKTFGCSNLILQTTVDRTGGYCMPCVQAVARKEREEYIRKNRRDLNEFEGVSDVVEIIKIIHSPRSYDPLINWIPHPTPPDRLYLGLTTDEASHLAKYAEGLIGTDRHSEAEEICLCLSAFTDAPLDDCLRALLLYGSIWPSLAFRRAPADVRDELLTRVESDANNRNHIILALAWIGDSMVVEQFGKWRNAPPAWRDSLYIPPEDYARSAGWELTPDGKRRDLFFHRCFALKNEPSPAPELCRAVHERSGNCPWCSSKLTNLFEVALTSLVASSDVASQRPIEVLTCEVCTAFGTIFSNVDRDGRPLWSTDNVRPNYLPDDAASWGRLPSNCLRLAEPRPATYAADQFLPTQFSQLGGHPTWIQDEAYPTCLACRQTMMFLAQLDRQDVERYCEGTYYAFVCLNCMTTATSYQQT